MRNYILFILFNSTLIFTACLKVDEYSAKEEGARVNTVSLDNTEIPFGFNYRTTSDVAFQIYMNAPDGNPITGVPVNIGHMINGEVEPLFTIVSDNNGLAEGIFNVPDYIEEVVLSPDYIGLPNDLVVPISGNLVSINLSGARLSGNVNVKQVTPFYTPNVSGRTTTILNYKYLSAFNNQGLPSVLAGRDVVSSQMLKFINNSLPESRPVPSFHPSYLQQTNNTDLDITQLSDVWVTFVHEGAGYTNSLGFYIYSTNNPPSSVSQIDTVHIAFPNASYYNSGGGLRSGDKVKIGTFPAGTSIGFVCISNGWNGSGVGDGFWRMFSDKNLNVPALASLKQQSILLYDNVNQQYYIGFEDISRDNSGCDNDFNDMVIYAKSNPVAAISNKNVQIVDNGTDSDNDGVSDVYDQFPNDNSLAYKNILPAPGTFGTLAFEDLWPSRGDYDMNDLVVGYQFEQYADASNKIKQMNCTFVVRAIGAHFKHGFGFQMNVSNSAVSSITGQKLYDNIILLNNNNTEKNVSLATVVAFDNDFKVMNRNQGSGMNTDPLFAYQTPDTVALSITFNSPRSQSELGTAPFNPFIFIDGARGKEVHLPGYRPTTQANTTLFGSSSDNTSFSTNTFYLTKKNLPYALHTADDMDYPIEKAAINDGHLKFVDWVLSGGSTYRDWYKNVATYRNAQKIYSK